MTRTIKDEHSKKDDFAAVTNPGNAHVIDEHKIAIQYLQYVSDSYNSSCTYRWWHNESPITRQKVLPKGINANHNG